jgi:hypothetical protein
MGFDNVDGNSSDCDICINFDAWLVAYYGTYYYVADLSWEYDDEHWFESPYYPPEDVVGIYFDDSKWMFDSPNNKISEFASASGDVDISDDDLIEGITGHIDMGSALDGEPEYFTIRLLPVGDYAESTRVISAMYVHTYWDEDVDVSSTVSIDGISVSFSPSKDLHREPTTTEGDGDTIMKIRQSEMETNP